MQIGISFEELIGYTAWQRQHWLRLLTANGNETLSISAGPHGDGRFGTIGDLVRHIFSAEKRYVERLRGFPLTDTSSIPGDDVETLFRFGEQSRTELTELARTFPPEDWDQPRELQILSFSIRATPRKIVMHTLMHEIRHWAQIATILRLRGISGEFQDFLFSPVMDGEPEA